MKIAFLALIAMTASSPAQKTPAQRTAEYLEAARVEMKIPGLTFAVVKDGKVVQEGALGESNLTYHVKTENDTPFLIASVTKQFTSAAIFKLIEQGKVSLDDPITKHIPESPEAWNGITIRHLLSHTGGLKDRFEEADTSQWKVNYPKDAMLKAAKATAPVSKPGEKWLYTDQGFPARDHRRERLGALIPAIPEGDLL